MRVRRQATATPVVALLFLATAFGTVLAGALGGCAAAPDQEVVAVALPSGDGRWDDVADTLRDRLATAGFTVDVRLAGDDIPTQVMQVRELLDERPRALIVAPVDAQSLTPILDDADPRIAVVSFGTLIRDTAAVDRYVATDAAAAGRLQGIALLQGLGLVDDAGEPATDAPPGPFRIELIAGSPDDEDSAPQLAGALAVLQPYLDARVLRIGSGETTLDAVGTLRGSGATAASRLTRILHETYEGAWPDAVLAPSDQIARAVAGVLGDAGAIPGEGFPVVTGGGCELRSLTALVDGRQYSTLLLDPRELAVAAADAAADALTGLAKETPAPGAVTVDNGARVLPAALLPPAAVRVGDIGPVVVGSGYWSAERVADAIAEYALTPTPTPTPTPDR
jgi:putative multiple sugar transport system substrate-binding protein